MENLVGFVLPPFVELVNKDIPDGKERFIVSFIVCVGVSLLLHWQEVTSGTQLNVADVAKTFAVILTESSVVYNLYWKDSYLRGKMQNALTKGDTIKEAETVPVDTQPV